MNTRLLLLACVSAASAAHGGGLPKTLQDIPPEARQAAAAIQQAVQRQHGLIEKTKQATTPEEREAIFRSVAQNVQAIARNRVLVLEEHAKLARARVKWAREHADQITVHDLVAAHREAPGQPRSPFEKSKATRSEKGPLPKQLSKLPPSVAKAREAVKQSAERLDALRQQATTARTDAERDAIRRETERHLKAIGAQRVAILEAALDVCEQRLAWARKRAEQ